MTAAPVTTTPETAIAPAPVEAQRTAQPAPESKDAVAATAVEAAVVPPKGEVKLPQPPIHAVAAPNTEAAKDPLAAIVQAAEQHAAQEIGAEAAKHGINITGKNVTLTVGEEAAKTTPETHACTGPDCASCAAAKAEAPAAELPAVAATTANEQPKPAEVQKPEAKAEATTAEVPAVEQPAAGTVVPALTPQTEVTAPATHVGMAANAPTIAKTA